VRAHGDVKTKKSRRTLRLPAAAVEALRSQRVRQSEERLRAGPLWQDGGLVFASTVGTPLEASHVRRAFKKICDDAGVGSDWTPRELWHTFVSIMKVSRIASDATFGGKREWPLPTVQLWRPAVEAPAASAKTCR
jgi:integrase